MTRCALFQPVLHFSPDGRIPQGLLHNLVQPPPVLDSMGTGAVGNVVVDAHGKGIGLLEHHPHPLAQQVHVHAAVDVLAVQQNPSLNAAAPHQIVHAVQRLQQGGLSAARWPDEGSYLPI